MYLKTLLNCVHPLQVHNSKFCPSLVGKQFSALSTLCRYPILSPVHPLSCTVLSPVHPPQVHIFLSTHRRYIVLSTSCRHTHAVLIFVDDSVYKKTCLPLKMRNSTLTAKNSKINKKRVNLETFGFAVNEHMHYSNSPPHFFNQLFSVSVQAHNKTQTAKQRRRRKKKTLKKTNVPHQVCCLCHHW